MLSLTTLLAQTETNPGELGTFTPPTEAFSEGSAEGTTATVNLENFLSNTIGILTILGGVFFVVYFIIAALGWITAGGDASKVQKSRDKMVMAVIGMVILIMSYGLIGIIGTVLGLNLLQPGAGIRNLVPGTTQVIP